MSSIVVVQQMIKWVTCSMVHSELGYQEPFRRFIAYDMRVERCGKHIIQPLVDRTYAFPMGSGIAGNYGCGAWKLGDAFCFSRPNQAFKGSDICGNAWACWSWGSKQALMAFDEWEPRRCPFFHFPLLELVALSRWDWLVEA